MYFKAKLLTSLALCSILTLLLSACDPKLNRDYVTQEQIAPIEVRSEIPEGLLDNARDFETAFFKRFKLRHAPEPLQLSEKTTKNYFFPTFYGNVTTTVAMFFCSLDEASKLMPSPAMKPVSMGRGRALVMFSSYQYNRILGIGPYREIAISIPVLVGAEQGAPAYPLIAADYPGLGFYVLSMPVTSLENKIRGRKIWGLPKDVEQIDFTADAQGYLTVATNGAGNKYLEFYVPFVGDETRIARTYQVYTMLDGRILKSSSTSDGVFLVHRSMSALFFKNLAADREYLKLGEGEMAEKLKRLRIEKRPFQLQFSRDVSSAFDLPDPGFKSP